MSILLATSLSWCASVCNFTNFGRLLTFMPSSCIVEGDVVVDGSFSIKSSLFDNIDLREMIEQ